MKGMEPMIQNAKRGLPVDIRKIPPPPDFAETPSVEFGKEQLQRQDSSGTATRILNDLSNQVKKARSLSTQFTQLGNIEKAALMEKWASQSQRDMDIINMCLKRGERLPKVVYERRNIQLIKKYSDLRNNECEITMHRVLSIPGKYVGDNCFVLVEFPYPREKPFSAKTNYIKGNPNPELKFTVKAEINRGHTAFKRAVKNKSIKFVLCQKGGIFSSDKIIGQAQLALSVLESKCEVHTGLTFMDGRRPLETKIEVAVRLSEPIEASEMVNEDMEWVIVETKKGQSVTINPAQPSGNQPTIRCISVIAHEMKVEEALVERSKKTQNRSEYAKHSASKKALGEELLRVKKFMQSSPQNKNQYILAIKVQLGKLNSEAQSHVQSGSREKAKLCLQKKKLIENELKSFSSNRVEYT
jgi:coiled-coil and C2 domain-containing protein 1